MGKAEQEVGWAVLGLGFLDPGQRGAVPAGDKGQAEAREQGRTQCGVEPRAGAQQEAG